jgi:hypothetical protein
MLLSMVVTTQPNEGCMTRRHSSFLIRFWELRDGLQRIEIEHIQSGEKALFKTVEEALRWIDLQTSPPAVPDAPPLPGGKEGEEIV